MNVFIVGGGLGGLSTAPGLAKAGHTVRVLEREREFAGLVPASRMSPNATRILREWGISASLVVHF